MIGERQVDQSSLFYEFSLDRHVPGDLSFADVAKPSIQLQLGNLNAGGVVQTKARVAKKAKEQDVEARLKHVIDVGQLKQNFSSRRVDPKPTRTKLASSKGRP